MVASGWVYLLAISVVLASLHEATVARTADIRHRPQHRPWHSTGLPRDPQPASSGARRFVPRLPRLARRWTLRQVDEGAKAPVPEPAAPAPSPDLDSERVGRLSVELLHGVDRDLAPFVHRGITLQQVEQVYCTFNLQSFRVQILDNQMYIAGELPGFAELNLRNKKMLALIAARYPDDLPDVDFVIQNSDWFPPSFNGSREECKQQGPMFTANKQPHDTHGILFPDESWLDWELEQGLIYKAAQRRPWEARDPRLLFRGAPNGERARLLNASLAALDTDLLDVRLVDSWWHERRESFMSPAEQCRSQFLLYMAGNTWSSRMKKLLLCGSTVVVHPSPHVGFWWHLLQHEHNAVIMDAIRDPAKASEQLEEIVAGLRSNTTRARAIAAEGQRLAKEVLTVENALAYWYHLLWEYSKLQRFKPMLHRDAIPLDRSIFTPQELVHQDFSQRLCQICVPQPSDKETVAAFTGEHYLKPKT